MTRLRRVIRRYGLVSVHSGLVTGVGAYAVIDANYLAGLLAADAFVAGVAWGSWRITARRWLDAADTWRRAAERWQQVARTYERARRR